MTRLLILATVLLAIPAPAAKAGSSPREYLASMRASPELQAFLDDNVAHLAARDPNFGNAKFRIALVDLSRGDPPLLAHYNGETPVYPASVVKFVYLMAAYAFQEQGRLTIDPELDEQLTHMIFESSNAATQRVFARLTGTDPGPELPPDRYAVYRERRQLVQRWLDGLGVPRLHCVNPTYDGDGDLTGRDRQFVGDHGIPGGAPAGDEWLANRNAMTAVATAQLLALLATDRALTPADSATVRRRMKRDPQRQAHLVHRIAGGAARLPGLEAYSKSGTWGPIYADAGIVHHTSGREMIIVVFTQGRYRGDFIADLTERAAQKLLLSNGEVRKRPERVRVNARRRPRFTTWGSVTTSRTR
jgi:beta-lactamase class A